MRLRLIGFFGRHLVDRDHIIAVSRTEDPVSGRWTLQVHLSSGANLLVRDIAQNREQLGVRFDWEDAR